MLWLLVVILGILAAIFVSSCSAEAKMLIFPMVFDGFRTLEFLGKAVSEGDFGGSEPILEGRGGHLGGVESHLGALEGDVGKLVGPSWSSCQSFWASWLSS